MTSPELNLNSDLTDGFIDALENVTAETGQNMYNVFNDWLDLSILALERNDDDYLTIVNGYQDTHGEDTAQKCLGFYSMALGEMAAITAEIGHDVVGLAYEQLGMQSEAFAQYFTPHNLSDMMAEMTVVSDGFENIDPPLTVHDPACGSGRLLVSSARLVAEKEDAPPALFYGRDKASTCAKMTALNLALLGIAGVSVVGDSLKMEERTVWKIVPGGSPPIIRNPESGVTPEQADITTHTEE